MPLAPLPVILPLIAAVLFLAAERHVGPRVLDVLAAAVAFAVAAMAGWLAVTALDGSIVYWFGGWRPERGIAIGIGFVIDPAGGAVACFAAFLFGAAFVYGWRYFEDVRGRYHILMLVFMAGMVGFCLTGDLFNLFVFFELMSVAAFAVTAYKLEASSIEGALSFTIMNMIGSFLLLAGIALLYGRTGALDLAQIGRAVAAGPDDALLAMAFVLIVAGLLIKAAVMPFHFWLPDAHAVAPTPVCVIFSGIMVPVALFGVARIYWTVFASSDVMAELVRSLLIYLGTATAVLGGCACLAQRHIKRLLAFSTVSHVGVMLVALATLTAGGSAGFLLYLFGHGLTKGALFMVAGILMSQHQAIDEIALRGKARDLPVAGLALGLGALLLAGLPVGLMDGGRILLDAAVEEQHGWIPPLLALGSALTGAAVLRVGGRVFLGLGPVPGEEGTAQSKPEHEKPRPSALLLVPTLILLALCVGVQGHGVEGFAADAARRLMDQAGYAAAVLDGQVTGAERGAALSRSGPLLAWASVAVAVLVAAFDLSRQRVPKPLVRVVDLLTWAPFKLLDRTHTGHVGDYVAWTMFGLVIMGLSAAR